MITKFKIYTENYIKGVNHLNSEDLDQWNKDVIKILNDKFHNNDFPDRLIWNDFSLPYYYIELNTYYGKLEFKQLKQTVSDTILFKQRFEDHEDIQVFLDKIEIEKQKYLREQQAKKFKI